MRSVRGDPPAKQCFPCQCRYRDQYGYSLFPEAGDAERLKYGSAGLGGSGAVYENDHVNEQGESRHRVVSINPYFQQYPEMVLGEQEIVSGPYGPQLVCKPYPDRDLKDLLAQAVENLEAEITDYEAEELVEEEDHSIPADPSVANFSYTVYDGKIYYRENSRMKPVELSVTAQNRVKGMIAIRDCTRELIVYQTEGYPDEEIEGQQKKLNHLYDCSGESMDC